METPTAAELGPGGAPTTALTCQPLMDIAGTKPNPAPSAAVYRQFSPTGSERVGLSVFVRLSAYNPGDTERTLRAVRLAVRSCPNGFLADVDGETQDYRKVKELGAVKLGDEAVAYQLVGIADGQEVPMDYTVVRSGSNVVMYYALNLFAPESVEVPRAITEAQTAKLEKTARP